MSEREVVFLKFKSEYGNLYAKKLKLEKMQSNKDIHADKVTIGVIVRVSLRYSIVLLSERDWFVVCMQ